MFRNVGATAAGENPVGHRRALMLIPATITGKLRARPADDGRTVLLSGTEIAEVGIRSSCEWAEALHAPVQRKLDGDRNGVALVTRIQAVDEYCRPIAGVAVEISHRDAAGEQSDGTPGHGCHERCICGIQYTDSNGIVEFESVYPGSSGGCSARISFAVFASVGAVACGEIGLPETLTALLMEHVDTYRSPTREASALEGSWPADEGYLVQVIVAMAPRPRSADGQPALTDAGVHDAWLSAPTTV